MCLTSYITNGCFFQKGVLNLKKDNFSELITLWTHSSDAFLILDNDAKIMYANPVLEQVSGLDVQRQVGRNIRDLIKTGLINNSASLKAIQQRKMVTSKLMTSAGKYLLSTASPVMDKSGNIFRVICNVRSMSIVQYEEMMNNDKNETPTMLTVPGESSTRPYKIIKIDNDNRELVYNSQKMQHVVDMAYRLTGIDSTVLITGETGVGKELIARLIHNHSLRGRYGNMIKINCAAIPKDLIESELFGYKPGSFTGALKNGKPGYIKLADGGTLFLDEIAELPLEAQSKLLGVLQDKEYYMVGSTKPSSTDVRIIAATNRNLEEMVDNGLFRKDLYYRLHVIPVFISPLLERREDIPVLISYFSKKLEGKWGIKKEIDGEVINQLYNYDWPGNVRELESLLERLFITIPQTHITLSCLPQPYAGNHLKPLTLKEKVEQFELDLIKEELNMTRDKYEAAKNLGISISSLFRKIKLLEK